MLEEITTNQGQRFIGAVSTVTLAGKMWWKVGEAQVNPSYVISRTPWYPPVTCKFCEEEPSAKVSKNDSREAALVAANQ